VNFKVQCADVFLAMRRLDRPASIAEIAKEVKLPYETVRLRLKALEVGGTVISRRPDMRKPSQWWIS
jgi:DNA-binding Lrp family transcriptional regulator